jgi:hypothetical protein
MKNQEPLLDKVYIRRLLAVGCPVPTEEEETQPVQDLIVEVLRPEQTVAYVARSGAELLLPLRITNHSYGPLGIDRVECSPPWDDELFTVLGDPRRYTPEMQTYRMPSGREVPYESALNHSLCKGALEPGESREGILLAISMCTRIPMEYLHGETFLVTVVLVDQYGRSHYSTIEVLVDSSAMIRKPSIYRPLDGVRPGTLNGLDATQQPREPSIEEESNRRKLEMLAQEKIAKSRAPVDQQRRAPMSESEEEEEVRRLAQWLRQSIAKSRSEEKKRKATTGTQK